MVVCICNLPQERGGRSLPPCRKGPMSQCSMGCKLGLGTQTDTPMAVGGVYDGSPRCPAPVTGDWHLKQRPSWRIGGTRRSGMRPRPRCPEQIHRSSTTDGGVITAEVWNWITESQSCGQTDAEHLAPAELTMVSYPPAHCQLQTPVKD